MAVRSNFKQARIYGVRIMNNRIGFCQFVEIGISGVVISMNQYRES